MVGGKKHTSRILIRGARQLLTLRGHQGPRRGTALRELGIINDGALLVDNGVLQEVGPTRRLENLASARQAVEINAAGRVVMPGFVDSHTHLAYPLAGSSDDDRKCWARMVKGGTGARLAIRARTYLAAMARHGTTTVEVKTGCGPDENAETKLLRVVHELKHDPIDVIPTFLFRLPGSDLDGAHDAAAEWVFTELLPKIRRRKLSRFADLAWNVNPTWRGRFSRYLQTARHLGFGCKIHADQGSTLEAIRMAVEHLVVSIDHLEYTPPEASSILAEGSTLATLLPCSSYQRGIRFAPARGTHRRRRSRGSGQRDFNPRDTPALSMRGGSRAAPPSCGNDSRRGHQRHHDQRCACLGPRPHHGIFRDRQVRGSAGLKYPGLS